jgi:DNA helicase-2/ATP-dependent DNA helicase PcrA
MTVHGAKGLEFQLVVLTGMEEDMLPYRGMREGNDHDIEEERRLAYVAITRARSRLVMTHVGMRQIFGTTRLGRPSQFLAAIPKEAAVHKATRAAGQASPRFIDRPSPYGATSREPWRHPFAKKERESQPPEPGERFIDREFFDDGGGSEEGAMPMRRGSRVVHAHFGEGEVRSIVQAAEPAAVVFFPVWGEKKVLARFLRLA